jgi:hypothetical protein
MRLKFIFILLLGVFYVPTLRAQLFPYEVKNKYGFKDAYFNVVVKPIYDFGQSFFSNEMGVVGKKGKYGLINDKGKLVIPLMYDTCGPLIEGRIVASYKKKFGFIDHNNKVLFDFKYQDLWEFSRSGTPAKLNDKWGMIDSMDHVMVSFEYDEIIHFGAGYLTLRKGDQWGLMDRNLKLIVPFNYRYPIYMDHGFASVWIGDKAGLVDSLGNLIIPIEYKYVMIDNNSRSIIVRNNTGCGLFNINGIQRLDCIYDKIESFENYLRIILNGKEGLCDGDGRILVQPENDYLYGFADDYFIIVKNNKSGFYNHHLKKMVTDIIYDDIEASYYSSSIIVVKDGKDGLLDSNANVVLPPVYDNIGEIAADTFLIEQEGKSWRINATGKKLE